MVAAPEPSNTTVAHHRRRRFDLRVEPHRRRSRLRLQDWRMRTKLAAVLIIPSVAFLVVAAVQTGAQVGQATALNQFARQVGAGQPITALVNELQRERDRTAGELAGMQRAAERLDPVQMGVALRPFQEAVDRAVAEFRRAAGPLQAGDASWQVSYVRASEALDQLPDLRLSALGGVVGAATILGNYTRTIDALLALLAEPSPGAGRPELAEAVRRYVQLARVDEIGSRIRARLYRAARAGAYGPEDLAELSDLRAQRVAALAEFRIAATTPQIQRYELATLEPRFVAATRMEESSVGAGGTPVLLDPTGWWSVSEDRHELLREVEASVLGDAVAQADARSADQLRRTLLVAGAVLAVLLVALLTSIAIGRSIARSLRILRGQALQVAQLELPDALERLRAVDASVPDIEVSPPAVRSMDEIGDVAEAFVAVHRSAVKVAVEQAVMRRNVNAMFVNLARRSQVLVERQLELLDELERQEGDPDQLDNLFKLDHLAARMRRNDENLLVLAGTESSRRWTEPVALSAVTLAAATEIEQYPRVRHDSLDQLFVVGHAVADLVHLLAELLENATSFSPPDTSVQIFGRAYSGRSAVIEIADEGLGMTDAALAEANAILAAPPAADVAASERMGLFVVSHLATRHGIRVQLRPADPGLVAAVWLPAALLAAPPQREVSYLPGRPILAAIANGVNGSHVATHSEAPSRELRVATLPAVHDPADLPVAGRRPPQVTLRRSDRRSVPTRAEDVLPPVAGERTSAGSAWWSRQDPGGTQASPPAPRQPAPAAPITGGVNASGLPVRVPMAHLPMVTESAPPVVPAPREEPDPEAVGSTLSRFYGGVRRAEAEDTTEIAVAPGGRLMEEE